MAFTGCLFIPYPTEHIELDSGVNPFSRVVIGLGETRGPDIIEIYIDISDSNRDLRDLSIKNLVLVDSNGRAFHLTVQTEKTNSSSIATSLHQASITIHTSGMDLSLKTPFKLSFSAIVGSETVLVDGTCHEAKEFHMTNAWELGR